MIVFIGFQVEVRLQKVHSLIVLLVVNQRTEAEYRALLAAAGFELTKLIPLLPPYYILEAVRV